MESTYTARKVIKRHGQDHFAEITVRSSPGQAPSHVTFSAEALDFLRTTFGEDFEYHLHNVRAAVLAQINTANVSGEMPHVAATSFHAEVQRIRVSGNAGPHVSGALLSMAGMHAIGDYLEAWELSHEGRLLAEKEAGGRGPAAVRYSTTSQEVSSVGSTTSLKERMQATYTGSETIRRSGKDHTAEVTIRVAPSQEATQVTLSAETIEVLQAEYGADSAYYTDLLRSTITSTLGIMDLRRQYNAEFRCARTTTFRAEVVRVRVSGKADPLLPRYLLNAAASSATLEYLKDWEAYYKEEWEGKEEPGRRL